MTQKDLEKYTKVVFTTLSLPSRDIQSGPIESDFFFEGDDLVISKINIIFNQEFLEEARRSANEYEVIWGFGTGPIVYRFEFS